MRDASHRADLFDLRQLARPVVLPQPVEAAQLALEIARRLAEALETGAVPIRGVQFDQRVDQLVRDPPVLLG